MLKISSTILLLGLMSGAANASTVTLFEGDGEKWKSAVGYNFTTIDFAGGSNFAFINDDYADEGIVFGSNANYWNTTVFLNDAWGMEAVGGAWLTFDTPQRWIAADHPGVHAYSLYANGELIYASPMLSWAGPSFGNFSGLISSQSFDMVYIHRPDPWGPNIIAVDDLYFGVPAPGALALLALGGLVARRKRRA